MSRFEYDDDGEPHITWQMWQWNLDRALVSDKGQAKLREFREALLAVPGHRLVSDQIATLEGDVCAIGAFAAYKRTLKGQPWAEATADLNQEFHPVSDATWRRHSGRWEVETDGFATQELGMRECGLNSTLAWHLGQQNDEDFGHMSPEHRWQRTYDWVCEQLADAA
jgi:hypothetical protein